MPLFDPLPGIGDAGNFGRVGIAAAMYFSFIIKTYIMIMLGNLLLSALFNFQRECFLINLLYLLKYSFRGDGILWSFFRKIWLIIV